MRAPIAATPSTPTAPAAIHGKRSRAAGGCRTREQHEAADPDRRRGDVGVVGERDQRPVVPSVERVARERRARRARATAAAEAARPSAGSASESERRTGARRRDDRGRLGEVAEAGRAAAGSIASSPKPPAAASPRPTPTTSVSRRPASSSLPVSAAPPATSRPPSSSSRRSTAQAEGPSPPAVSVATGFVPIPNATHARDEVAVVRDRAPANGVRALRQAGAQRDDQHAAALAARLAAEYRAAVRVDGQVAAGRADLVVEQQPHVRRRCREHGAVCRLGAEQARVRGGACRQRERQQNDGEADLAVRHSE